MCVRRLASEGRGARPRRSARALVQRARILHLDVWSRLAGPSGVYAYDRARHMPKQAKMNTGDYKNIETNGSTTLVSLPRSSSTPEDGIGMSIQKRKRLSTPDVEQFQRRR